MESKNFEFRMVLTEEQQNEIIDNLVEKLKQEWINTMEKRSAFVFVNCADLAKIFGVSENTIRNMRSAGMPCMYFGSVVRYDLAEATEWFRNFKGK